MLLSLAEPASLRYLYINPENNLVHLLVPIVGGQEISTDNTCKSTASLKEFFESGAALRELKSYQLALEFDLQFLNKHHPLRQPKKERLNQIKKYIEAITAMQGQYSDAITALMQRPSNLYSIQLRPCIQDPYSRVINPVFNINRENDGQGNPLSALYNAIYRTFPDVAIAVHDPRSRLIKAVSGALTDAPSFEEIQQVLGAQSLAVLGLSIDFRQGSDSRPVTRESVDEDYLFNNDASTEDYIEALLNTCAIEVWTTLPTPPFYSIPIAETHLHLKTEKLSILTQFFLAHLNIYCAVNGISGRNFGTLLDASAPLSDAIVAIVSSALSAGNPVEESLCTFFNEHSKEFGLTHPLNQDDMEAIKQKFDRTWAAVTATPENPHMDDFMILDTNAENGLFVTHQGSICTDFTQVFPSLDNSLFTAVRADFEAMTAREVPHNNKHIQASIDLDIKTLISRLKDDNQFEKLPQNIRDACMQSPAFQMHRFLHDVAKGKQDEADNQLLNNSDTQDLLTGTGVFTDYSGRTFNCTAYEYAWWAKDTHMRRMLEQHMDEDTKAQLLKRCEAIEKDGLKYHQNGTEYITRSFDFSPLKQALRNYTDAYDNWNSTNNFDARNAAWVQVGLAQRDVPVHVINEYCRKDRSFDPMPQFNENNLPRVVTYYNYHAMSYMPLFPLELSDSSGLGVDFGLIRAPEGAIGARVSFGAAIPRLDLAAISRLDEVRTADLTRSRENLTLVEPRHDHG